MLEKLVSLENNEKQEGQKKEVNPFCPDSSSRWVRELVRRVIHHSHVDIWGCLSPARQF